MEKQAALSSSAVADVAVPGTCKVSVLAPKATKRIAFLSDLPDDVLLKCTVSLDVHSFLAYFRSQTPLLSRISAATCHVPAGLSLASPSSLGALAQTCKRLRSIASADNLWQPLSLQMWGQLKPQSPQSFKQVEAPHSSIVHQLSDSRPRCTASPGVNGLSRWTGYGGHVP